MKIEVNHQKEEVRKMEYPVLMEHQGLLADGKGNELWRGIIVVFSNAFTCSILWSSLNPHVKAGQAYCNQDIMSPIWKPFKGSITLSSE
jgi:hypothetical protein